MKKTTIAVMIVTILAKIFGFLRDKVITYFFGVGIVSDAFMLSFAVPSLILTVVAASFVTGFIPMYTRVRHDDPDKANDFVNNVFNIMIFFTLILGIVMFVFPGQVVKINAIGFNARTHALASQFLRVISFSVLSVSIVQLGTGYLNVHESFILPNLLSIPSNLVIIASVILSSKSGNTNILPYGALLGYTLQGVLILWYMHKFGFRFKAIFDFKEPYLIEMLYLAVPLLISTVILSLTNLIMMSYATYIYGEGGYSLINMSTRLSNFAIGIFVLGILSVAFPTIVKAAAKNDKKEVIDSMNEAILLIALFIIPVMIGFAGLSLEVVTFVYGGGEVTLHELTVLASMFMMSTFSLFSQALRDLFTRIHYAYKDTKTPLISNVIFGLVSIVLFLILGHFFGIEGLTLASTISVIVSSIYLFFTLLERFKQLGMVVIIADLAKILVSSLMMGVVIFLSKSFLFVKLGNFKLLIITGILSFITYAAMLVLLKVEVFLDLIKR